MESIREKLPQNATGDHAGLILDSYLRHPVKDSDHIESKKALLNNVVTASKRDNEPFILARERWLKSVLATGGRLVQFKFRSYRTILGFGGEHVTDSGLTLHHTYGVPYLPGSSLKGIAAHWAHDVLGKQAGNPDWERGGLLHRLFFGTNDAGGLIVFLDGWPLSESSLIPEVMTPHHPQHYVGKDDAFVPASDFDEPTPIQFLAVNTPFLVGFKKRDADVSDEWFDVAENILANALLEDGIGGKTSNDYGRFESGNASDIEKLIKRLEEAGKSLRERIRPARSESSAKKPETVTTAPKSETPAVTPPKQGDQFEVVVVERNNAASYRLQRCSDGIEFVVRKITPINDKDMITFRGNKREIYVEVVNAPTSWNDVELKRRKRPKA